MTTLVRAETCLVLAVSALLAVSCVPPGTETARVEEIPVTTTSDTARQLFEEGEYLLNVGRGVQAREKFLAALTEDPAFVRAHVNQSNAALSF